ncbi:chemotaxis protein CheB [Flavobacterium sp.]|uniref:chemotaxis protein CheB n=1 Tax=Flavobacterium sp. TaxID=239 RepID=UPI0025FA2B38|nr:chemotaxis protein CheB [Flavobacterium sp.]
MKEPAYIIAIGASAGGLEEINTFFDHTPLDSAAYVIVQHLSSSFRNRMIEVLAKHSKLTIKEAEEGMKVYANVVYLIPNNKFMTIKDRKLCLTDKSQVQGPHLTINTFFKSLAADCGIKAIGIILSGFGSDGSEGIKDIKQAGGMIIARNPETTQFNSMPANAIATDMVDFILEPEFMPRAIESYIHHSETMKVDSRNEEKAMERIIEYLAKKLPFDFSDYKMSTILRRTKRRAVTLNLYDLDKYLEILKESPEELKALAQDFLISVTSFFRDIDSFEQIKKNVLPHILGSLGPNDEIKIWVAGCATGEEAYSLAIMLKEQLTGDFKDRVVKIFATDIDSAALITAGKGSYPAERMKNVSESYLTTYFDIKGDNYVTGLRFAEC